MGRFRAFNRRRIRAVWAAGIVFLVVTGLILGDWCVLMGRVRELSLRLSTSVAPDNILIVGIDDKDQSNDDLVPAVGVADARTRGARADASLLLTKSDAGVVATSISRDILVGEQRHLERLALTWMISPQTYIDHMCQEIGVPVKQVVVVNFSAMAAIVKAAGGIDVTIPHALQDQKYSESEPPLLDLHAGTNHLDGLHAVAFARSRRGTILMGDEWVVEPDGARSRQDRSMMIVAAVSAKLRKEPWRLRSAADAAGPHIAVNTGFSISHAAEFAKIDRFDVLPVEHKFEFVDAVHDGTREYLSALGYRGCTI